MKKFYTAIVTIIFCIQQTQSMELTIPSNNDNGYPIIHKIVKNMPCFPISKEPDPISEQLYKANITDTEIKELVKKGANLNYKTPDEKVSTWPIPLHYAFNETLQGVKNMKTIIELGAAIHHIDDEEHTPLTIALDQDAQLERDFTDMIQLLTRHEEPTVTIYKQTYHDKEGCNCTTTYAREQNIRERLISHSFSMQKIVIIKSLLDLKLMTANRGMKEFINRMNPNQKILDLLFTYGADNAGDVLPQLMEKAFPNDRAIIFFEQISSQAFNKEVLQQMRALQQNINNIVSALENNEPK